MIAFPLLSKRPTQNFPRVNWSSPSAKGLMHAWPLYSGNAGARLDVVGVDHGVLQGTVIKTEPGPIGLMAQRSAGDKDRCHFGSNGFGAEFGTSADGTLQSTIVCIAQLAATGARNMAYADYNSSGTLISAYLEAQAAGTWRTMLGGNTFTGGTTDLKPHIFITTRFGYAKRIAWFVDGVEIASNSSAGVSNAGSQRGLGPGGYTGGVKLGWNGWVYDLRMYDRAMYDEEIRYISRRENWFDCYAQEKYLSIAKPAAPPAGDRIMSSLAARGGLAGQGGIAGIGGGLAA